MSFTPIRRLGALVALVFLAGCGADPAAETEPGPASTGYVVETVAEGFEYPWSIAFLPDGDMLVTELPGRLWRVTADGAQRIEIDGTPDVVFSEDGQGGLMEVLLSPDFETDQLVYLSYADGRPTSNATAIWRARLENDALVDGRRIFRAAPDKDTGAHYGGRMAFLPDGTLLLGIGEGFAYREQAQIVANHFGSIVRLNPDGSAASDNPELGPEARAEIYSYGHRNPQGLIVDRRDGSVWSHEHGPRGGDELNRIEAGANYGWPIATAGVDYSFAQISPYSDHSEQPGLTGPVYGWTPSIAPSSLELYLGDAFPDWRGDFFVTSLVSGALHRLDMENGEVSAEERLLEDRGARLRDVAAGPDGFLYVLTEQPDWAILRLTPAD
jgi:glucose/arabinose dehydrogenase